LDQPIQFHPSGRASISNTICGARKIRNRIGVCGRDQPRSNPVPGVGGEICRNSPQIFRKPHSRGTRGNERRHLRASLNRQFVVDWYHDNGKGRSGIVRDYRKMAP